MSGSLLFPDLCVQRKIYGDFVWEMDVIVVIKKMEKYQKEECYVVVKDNNDCSREGT